MDVWPGFDSVYYPIHSFRRKVSDKNNEFVLKDKNFNHGSLDF